MATLLLPFHQDEDIGPHSIVLPRDRDAATVHPDLPAADQWSRLAHLYDALAREVAASVQAEEATTVVTGDCLALLGTLTGVQRAGLTPSLVWFDAHGDVHTLASSETGYLGGMALRMAVGGDAEALTRTLGLAPVPESNAVLVDARDLDPAEVEYLRASGIARTQVDEIGAADVPAGPVVLHVDLDVIDSDELPGLRFPVTPGPTTGSVLAALDRLLATGQVVAFDIACPWFEPRDSQEADRREQLLASVTGLVR